MLVCRKVLRCSLELAYLPRALSTLELPRPALLALKKAVLFLIVGMPFLLGLRPGIDHVSSMNLAYGGDDITELFAQLLLRANFPYSDLNLNRAYDWQMLDALKESICVLSEVGYLSFFMLQC